MDPVVEFDADVETLTFLRGQGIDPNEFARRLFEAEVRRLRANEWRDMVRAMNIRLPRPAADIIREDRDAH